MNVERSTSVYCGAACCLGTVLLGVGEESYGLAAAAVIVSVGSVVLCDRLRWLQLSNLLSNLASIAVLIYAFVYSAGIKAELRILAMADLMAHLQFILQFKAKSTRTYWLLIVVSFLQTAVAAALHTGVMFGLYLLLYLFCALFFLAYFYLYREERRFGRATSKSPAPIDPAAGRDFARRVFNVGLGTIALSAFFFVAVPRIGQSNWMPAGFVTARAVGFSPEINLTASGSTIQDPEVVMQVRFFDYKTGLPRQIDGDIYMRGTTSRAYDEGKWISQGEFRGLRPGLPAVTELASEDGLLRQQVTIEPLSRANLFACYPVFTDRPEQAKSSVFYNPFAGLMTRNDAHKLKRFEYEVLTPGFQRHKQGDLLPAVSAADYERYRSRNQWPSIPNSPSRESSYVFDPTPYLGLPLPQTGRDPLAALKQLARDVTADVPASDPFRRAKKLEAVLRDSGRFRYQLESGERPQGIDPLEHFVSERPEGHCEFFAGALAMMLRAVNIPSRVVIGFRGGNYNVVGSFYEFQQLHAHSWVEAYLPPGKAPLERIADTPGLIPLVEQSGAWLQLDGTPAAETNTALAGNSMWFQIQQTIDYVKFLWNNYVVGMDSMRQDESIYKPIVSSVAETTKSLTSREFWTDLKSRALGLLPSRAAGMSVAVWAGLVTVTAAVMGVIFWYVGGLRKRRATSATTSKATRAAAPVEEFYLQFERLLARIKLVRTADQTQREFALAAGGELAELQHTRSAAPLPKRIVDHYYRVRFGNRPLHEAERADVEQALAELAAAVPDPAAKPQA